MPLDAHTSHPSSRSYVLKLHRDARPQSGELFGRLESLSSGRCLPFASADELIRCLVNDSLASLHAADAPPPDRQ